jgi:diguanylate cyclase (GGDEF)-like protein
MEDPRGLPITPMVATGKSVDTAVAARGVATFSGDSLRWLIGAVGLVVAGLLLVSGGPELVASADAGLVVLVGCVVLGDLRVARRSAPVQIEISTGGVFAFALLLGYGTTAAALAMALGSVVGDIARPKPARRVVMNAGLWTLTCTGAGLALAAARGGGSVLAGAPAAVGELPAVACAGLAFFLVNFGLVMWMVALDMGRPALQVVREEVWRGAAEDAAGLSIATVIGLAGVRPSTLPLLVLPLILAEGGRRVAASEARAVRDPLTGLPNRALLIDRVQQALARAKREDLGGAVLLVDLDGFKAINDSLGHHAGDDVLAQVAARLTGCVRAADTVARLGGDEFALVLDATVEPASTAVHVCDKIVAAVGQPFVVGDSICRVGASIGVACFPDDATDVQSLLKHADAAMYEAKARGKLDVAA